MARRRLLHRVAKPDDLLPNPIWHHTFEPGVELIKSNMDTFRLEGATDYREIREDHSNGFAAGSWSRDLPELSPSADEATVASVGGREFPVLATRPSELGVTFAQLCETPLSTIEYLQWVRSFSRWFVTEVSSFAVADPEAQQRFIHLVDVLVDADVEVTFVSECDLATFLAHASLRPDSFLMASRLRLLLTDTHEGTADQDTVSLSMQREKVIPKG